MIEIVASQERWPEEFRLAGARLRSSLGALALRIDHIGSTSVPGLASKDIIDVQVTVAELEPASALLAAFCAAGYREGASTFDHRPPGNTAPEREWQKRYFREPGGARRTHIHVRAAGRANQRYALLFRDYLRANSTVAAGYERAKRELARLHPDDIDAYLAVKDPVCDIIMAGAELWAAAKNWGPDMAGSNKGRRRRGPQPLPPP